MVAITQKSKIHLRQGFQSDIPGAPSSLSPLTFSPGLDSGELAYTVDTGRLFIGGTSGVSSPAYERTTFPYQNVEVFTETSPALLSLIEQRKTATGQNGFIKALLTTQSTFTNVLTNVGMINVPNTSSYDGTSVGQIGFIMRGSVLNIRMDYFMFEGTTTLVPFASGTLRAMSVPSNTQAYIDDRRTLSPNASTSGTAPAVVFQIINTGSDSQGPYYTFQYTSADVNTITMYFQISNPLA